MQVTNHNWSATKQCLHPQSVVEISRHNIINWKTENCHIGVNAQASGWHVPYSWCRQYTWCYLPSISHWRRMTDNSDRFDHILEYLDWVIADIALSWRRYWLYIMLTYWSVNTFRIVWYSVICIICIEFLNKSDSYCLCYAIVSPSLTHSLLHLTSWGS